MFVCVRLRVVLSAALLIPAGSTAHIQAQAASQPPVAASAAGPQVVQFGAFNAPQAVLNAQSQWSSLLPVSSNADVDTFIEDVSAAPWLQANASNFLDRGQYTLTVLSFYKTQRACRQDQIALGYSDDAHVNACNDIRYRVRQISVDAPQSVASVNFGAMVRSDGTLDLQSVRQDTRSRGFKELDRESQAAIGKATAIVARQAEIYNHRQQNQP